MAKIGYLNSGTESGVADLTGKFIEGLNSNVEIIWKFANCNYAHLPRLAEQLVEQRVNVIATTGGFVSYKAAVEARAAAGATLTIPILFIVGTARAVLPHWPPQNATGVDILGTDHIRQRIDTLRQLLDHNQQAKAKIALLVRPRTDISDLDEGEARQTDANVVFIPVTNDDFEAAFRSAVEQNVKGLIVSADPCFTIQRATIVRLARQHHIFAVYPWREYLGACGLMSHGGSLPDAYRQVGEYTKRILNGESAQSLPIISATLGNPVIKKSTADALGLTIPPSLAAGAEII